MSLEIGDIKELRSKPEVDLSDAEISSNVAGAAGRLDIYEPEEQEREGTAETSIDEDDAGSPTILGAVPERLEIKTIEEPETDFEADFTKDILNLILASKNPESPFDAVAEQEHLENGECKELEVEEPVSEVASAGPVTSDSLIDSQDVVTPSYGEPMLEHLEDGVDEEPGTKAYITQVAGSDLTAPDSLANSNDIGTPLYGGAMLEDGESEEPKTEEHAAENGNTDANVPGSLAISNCAGTLSYRDAMLENLEDGEGEEPRAEEDATENGNTYLNAPDSLAVSNGAGTLSYRDAVLENLENGAGEEPRAEGDAAENGNTDADVPDSSTVSDDALALFAEAALLGDGGGEEPRAEEDAVENGNTDANEPNFIMTLNNNDALTLFAGDALLGVGEDEERRTEEDAAENGNADANVPGSLEISNCAGTLLYGDAVLENLEDGVGEEPRTGEDAAENGNTDADEPDSSTVSNDAVTLSAENAVLEDGEGQEPRTEEDAAENGNTDANISDSSTVSNDAGTLSSGDAVLEDRDGKELRTEEHAAVVAMTDHNDPDSLAVSNDSASVSYGDAVLENLEDGEGEEPRAEERVAENGNTDAHVPDSLTVSDNTVTISAGDVLMEDGDGEEPKMEDHAAVVATTDYNVPDSSTVSNDSASVSYRDAVLGNLEDGESEEPRTEEDANENGNTGTNVPDFSTASNGAVLEDGAGEELRTEEHAAVAIRDLNVRDSLKDSSDALSLSDLGTSTNCSALLPTQEATKEKGQGEELVDGTSAGDAVEVCSLPLEAVVQDGVDKVQVNQENAIAKNESEMIFENNDESEATPILERTADYLSSSKQLPLEVGKNVIQLQCESSAPDAPNGVCLVSIVGTAHVSKASCDEVQALIRHIKPDVVFLELCSSRTNVLLPTKREVPTLSSMIESYKKKQMNLFGLLYCWFLAKVGEKLEVVPGAEFRVAYEEAVKCGAVVTLGDRPIQITLQRTWRKMSAWHKAKFLCSMLTASFSLPSADEFQALMDKMGQSDELTVMIQELSKTYPTLLETLLSERDLYMVASLRTVARRYSSAVAVVGRGHLAGIADHWKEDINVDELVVVPPKSPWNRAWLWGTVALGVGGVVVGVNLLRRRW